MHSLTMALRSFADITPVITYCGRVSLKPFSLVGSGTSKPFSLIHCAISNSASSNCACCSGVASSLASSGISYSSAHISIIK